MTIENKEQIQELIQDIETDKGTKKISDVVIAPTTPKQPEQSDNVITVMNSRALATTQDLVQYMNNTQRYMNIVNDYDKNRKIKQTVFKDIVEYESTPRREKATNKYKAQYYKFAIGMNIKMPELININDKQIKLTTPEQKNGKTYTHNLIGKNNRIRQLFKYIEGQIYKKCYQDNKLISNRITINYSDVMELMGYTNIESVKDLFEKFVIIYRYKILYIKLYTKAGKMKHTILFGDFDFDKDFITIQLGTGGNSPEELQGNFWNNLNFNTFDLKTDYWKLTDKEFTVVEYIKEIIRNEKDTKPIYYRSIYNKLNLPETENNTRTKQTIKEPIQKIIAKLDFIFDDNDYYIHPKESQDKNIEKWLDNSYLIVIPNDQDKERNKEIIKKQQQHQKDNQHKKKKI